VLGALEGLSYVAVVGFAGWGLVSRISGGKGLPGAAAVAEYLSYAVIVFGLVVLALQVGGRVQLPAGRGWAGRGAWAGRGRAGRLWERSCVGSQGSLGAVMRARATTLRIAVRSYRRHLRLRPRPAAAALTAPLPSLRRAPPPLQTDPPRVQVAHFGYIPGALPDDKCYGAGASPIGSVGGLPEAAQALVSLLQKVSSVGRFVDVLKSS
jgi:hypothetical protein